MSAAIREACHIPASLEGEEREEGQGSLGPSPWVSQTGDHSHLGWDTDTAALPLTVMQCLENTSPKVDFPHPAGAGKAEIHVALQHWRLFLSLKVHQLW